MGLAEWVGLGVLAGPWSLRMLSYSYRDLTFGVVELALEPSLSCAR